MPKTVEVFPLTKKENSIFWKDLKKVELPDTLSKKLLRWKNNLPIEEDFNQSSKYILFRESNFSQIMHGLNLFDQDKIKIEYEMQRQEIKNLADKKLLEIELYEQSLKTISHKKFIELVRQGI
jgi:hypothetical protein